MTRLDRNGLTQMGFGGFVTFQELRSDWLGLVPKGPGAYVVVRESDAPPAFLSDNPGGRFKAKDPTVPVETLELKWVEGASVMYFGKAGVLQRRLREYAAFGSGKPVGHWGGRYIWQLADSAELRVGWMKCTPPDTEAILEVRLLEAFRATYGRLPFANIYG